MSDALLVALEADLRSLVGEARKGEGISLSGLFSSSQLPAIREAAERAADTLNLLSKQPDSAASVLSSSVGPVSHTPLCNLPQAGRQQQRNADTRPQRCCLLAACAVQDVLRPFLLTCESQAGKNSRLVLLALGALQKVLAAAEALAPALLSDIITAIETVRSAPKPQLAWPLS